MTEFIEYMLSFCLGCIINFASNGKSDDGLVVMKVSRELTEQFFMTFLHVIGRITWGAEGLVWV